MGLRELSQEDEEIREAVRHLRVECEERDGWVAVPKWFSHRWSVTSKDWVLPFMGRVVVAKAFHLTLDNIHRAHKGHTNMLTKASNSM